MITTKRKALKNTKKCPFTKLHGNVVSSAKPPSEKGLGDRSKGRTHTRKVEVSVDDLKKKFKERLQNGL